MNPSPVTANNTDDPRLEHETTCRELRAALFAGPSGFDPGNASISFERACALLDLLDESRAHAKHLESLLARCVGDRETGRLGLYELGLEVMDAESFSKDEDEAIEAADAIEHDVAQVLS